MGESTLASMRHTSLNRQDGALSPLVPVVVLSVLGLLFVLDLVDGLVVAVVTTCAVIPFWIILLSPGRRLASTMGYGYLLAALIAGELAAPSLIPDQLRGLNTLVLGYVVFLMGCACVLLWRPQQAELGAPSQERLGVNSKHLLLALGIAFVLGAAGWLLIVGHAFDVRNFIDDPQAARQAISRDTPSAYTWTAFRMLVVMGMLAYALSLAAHTRPAKLIALAITGTAFLLLLSYGARLLPGSLLLSIAVFRHCAVRPIRIKRTIIGVTAVLLVATWYAGYRYYAFFNEPFTSNAYVTTLARQVGGNLTDAARVNELYGIGQPVVLHMFKEQFTNSILPTFIQGHVEQGQFADFGAFASNALGQAKVGGIRVGAPSEVVLALGFVGAIVFGVIFGALLRVADRLLTSKELWKNATGAFLFAQLIFVVITGSTNLLPAIAAVACGMLLLRAGLRTEPAGALETPSSETGHNP